MLNKCTVLFVSLAMLAPLSVAEQYVEIVSQQLPTEQTEYCSGLAELHSLDRYASLSQLYQTQPAGLIWSHPERRRKLALAILSLAQDGLQPGDYPLALNPPDELDHCTDQRLSSQYLQALEHLHLGPVAQMSAEPFWQPENSPHSPQNLILQLAINGLDQIDLTFEQARPSFPLYRQLQRVYARGIPAEPDFTPLAEGPTLRPLMRDPRVPQLRMLLQLKGYLGTESDEVIDAADDSYNLSLQEALRQFQRDHGLEPDAVMGRQTLAALNLSPAQREQLLLINLHRMRWLSAQRQPYLLLINVAAGDIRLFQNDSVIWQSKVQTGQPKRPTPMLISRINRVTLNPSWTIPPTIFREDKLPQIRQDLSFLARSHLQVLDHQGNQLDPASIDWERPRGILLRQPPGPGNPLGRLVLRFPNPFSVYLHDTPSQHLFYRAERNLSSGCVRVQDAQGLASQLLSTLSSNQQARIQRLLETTETHEIGLPQGPQLILGYWTAEADANGHMQWFGDPYLHDPSLMEKLAPGAKEGEDQYNRAVYGYVRASSDLPLSN